MSGKVAYTKKSVTSKDGTTIGFRQFVGEFTDVGVVVRSNAGRERAAQLFVRHSERLEQ